MRKGEDSKRRPQYTYNCKSNILTKYMYETDWNTISQLFKPKIFVVLSNYDVMTFFQPYILIPLMCNASLATYENLYPFERCQEISLSVQSPMYLYSEDKRYP